MDGEVRDDQIRFAVTTSERLAWQAALKKRHLNGSSLLRDFMSDKLGAWKVEDAEPAA